MDFELEKIMAKVSGENVENFAVRVIGQHEKSQIDFALNQIFSGLSVLEWMKKMTLGDAWNRALDKMRDFIFSISEKNYIVDYLRVAVFEHRNQMLRTLSSSMHINEYIQYSSEQQPELEAGARRKIKNGIDIIQNLLSGAANPIQHTEQSKTDDDSLILQQCHERQNTKEHEREERIRK